MMLRTRRVSGFTLVEMMIVIAILGLLAAVAIPQFTSSKDEGKVAATVSSLSILRTAVDTYWSQHDDFPGQGSSTEFAEQICKNTNKAGEIGKGKGFGYGPYVRKGELPMNPLNGANDIKIVNKMPSKPSGNQAWIYDRKTGEIRCNVKGHTADGTDYFDL